MTYDFKELTSRAYTGLIMLPTCTFPLGKPPQGLIPGYKLKVWTYQEYAEKTNVAIEDLIDGDLKDAYTIKDVRPNINMILYNKDIGCKERRYFSIWHETAHILCSHEEEGEREEIEANFVAAQMCMPNALIRIIKSRGYTIDVKFLTEAFGVSKEAATKKMDYLSRFPDVHQNDYDKDVLMRYIDWIDLHFPIPEKKVFEDYDDFYEDQRVDWLYSR